MHPEGARTCRLDYPGIGPEHSWLMDTGRAEYHAITDQRALEALQLVSRLEGIIPALETSHAFAYLEVRSGVAEQAVPAVQDSSSMHSYRQIWDMGDRGAWLPLAVCDHPCSSRALRAADQLCVRAGVVFDAARRHAHRHQPERAGGQGRADGGQGAGCSAQRGCAVERLTGTNAGGLCPSTRGSGPARLALLSSRRACTGCCRQRRCRVSDAAEQLLLLAAFAEAVGLLCKREQPEGRSTALPGPV